MGLEHTTDQLQTRYPLRHTTHLNKTDNAYASKPLMPLIEITVEAILSGKKRDFKLRRKCFESEERSTLRHTE